ISPISTDSTDSLAGEDTMTDDIKESIAGRPFFCSWSGGKDSCLALYHAIQTGGKPHSLLTILSEDGVTSRSHALHKALLEEQARSLGVQPVFRSASWQQYEVEFVSALYEFKKSGIEVGVFGDIDVDSHREWVRRVCDAAGIVALHPLWKRDRRELLEEFIGLGFRAQIVVINEQKMDKRFLGKIMQTHTIVEMEETGIDPSGELGEYHTVVTDGPIFSSSVKIETAGERHHEGYWFLKVNLKNYQPNR
ncbi:MAG: diphthine--ammonia ligase, partial [Methanosarcinaceae archaeon]|nr:diphthine--ammonia ligase [Methanosarcinaceae archaeon]